MLPDVHARPARRDRHDHGRQGRAAARRRPPRRGRPVPRRRRRQGHGDLLGHRERDRDRVRLLARRRVRVGRLGRLRPQADGDHRPGRLGVGQAPLPRARDRHRDHRLHRRRNRRHVRRRVRQRDAALPPHPADRRVRPPPRLPRPESGRGGELRRARAALPPAGLVLGRLRPGADLARRRRLPAHGEVDPALARGPGGARRRGGVADAERADPRPAPRAGRPALERRHRHLREGAGGAARRGRRPCERRRPGRRRGVALPRRRRGRQPRLSRSGRGSRTRAAAAGSTWTRSTTRPASTAPTTRSTSRSCSTRSSPTAT